MSNANIGYDTRFAIEDAPGSGVFVELAEVYSVTPPEFTVDQIEVTHLQSPGRAKQFIPALSDPGTAQAEMNYIPGSASDIRLDTLRVAGTVLEMKITYPGGEVFRFQASVASYSKSIPVADRMTAQVGFKVSGPVTYEAPAAPTNLLLPSVSGIAQVGQTLTAIEGAWTGTPIYTYQWQEDDSGWGNITGATSREYVPVVGNVGNALRVIVTGTNSAGSASATSAATADTIAA
jgi:hypothetical protein